MRAHILILQLPQGSSLCMTTKRLKSAPDDTYVVTEVIGMGNDHHDQKTTDAQTILGPQSFPSHYLDP